MKLQEFENIWYNKIKDDILQTFPNEFISSENNDLMILPGKPLVKGTELFGSFEIIDTDGETLLSTDDQYKIKYILYSNLNTPKHINIPIDHEDLIDAVKEYEKHLDDIVVQIKNDYQKYFPDSDKLSSVANKIFQLLNLQRH